MRILELKRGSAEEAELLEAAADAHGDWVMAAAPLMMRLWLMRSAMAPGLRYVGGLAEVPNTVGSAHRNALSVGGTGLRLEDALAGCLAEAVERTAQVEREGDVVLSAPLEGVRIPDQIGELIELLQAHDPEAARGPIDWVRARDATTGAETLVPADWCLRRQNAGKIALPGTVPSTGTAAAAKTDEALARALLELIERDAAALWWLGGTAAAPLDPASAEAAAVARLHAELRQSERAARLTRVLDISSDFQIPVMAAFAHSPDGRDLAFGLGARLSPARAAGSALFELCQMELGLALARGKLSETGEAALSDIDRRHLARAAVAVEDLAPLVATHAPRHHELPARSAGRNGLHATALAGAGLAAWQVDLTRDESPLSVVKAIAPRLQPMPGDLVTARLSTVQRINSHKRRPSIGIV
jgi:ribosomal protein S12 methylthiotransferase accessory factor